MEPITNLTELWMDAEKNAALRLCALSGNGADYEVFRRLCAAFALMPGHPFRTRAAEQLRVLFRLPYEPLPEFCEQIWRETAEALLIRPLTRADADAIGRPSIDPRGECLSLPHPVGDLFKIPLLPEPVVRNYKEWETVQRESFSGNGIVRLILPKDYLPVRPDLYRVDRHLAGEAENPDLWLTQKVRFLAGELCRRGGTLLLQTACSPDAVEKMLCMVERQAALPPVWWLPENPADAASLRSLCDTIANADISLALILEQAPPAGELAALAPLGRVRMLENSGDAVRNPS